MTVANFKADTPMAIAGPLAFDHNVGQDIPLAKLIMFKKICQISNEALLNMN